MPPVRGATWPILTSWAAGAAGALDASADALAAGFCCSPQPANTRAAATSVMPTLLFIRSSGVALERANDTAPRGAFVARRGSSARPAIRSLLREDPLHQRAHVGVGNAGIGRHRHLAPGALAALLDLLDELRFRAGIAAVFRRNILVGRADQLLVDRVAGEAG